MIMISDKRFIVWICLSVLLPLWVMPAGAQEVVEEENYEQAAKIQEEIDKRVKEL